ncbi:MAG: PorT family protein [Cytophagales bacterium]|nr:PorT family protein [Cytophagales bacterium]
MRHSFLLLLLLPGLPVAAQPVLGVKGGLNVANVNGTASFFDPRIGFHAGVFATRDLSKRVSLQAEVVYSQKGFRHDNAFEASRALLPPVRFWLNAAHLDIPLVVKYRVFDRFTPYAGPQASVTISRKASLKGFQADYVTVSGGGGMVVGMVAGLGYRITNRLGADARYTRDLYGSSMYNHAFQAGLSFEMFSGNKR